MALQKIVSGGQTGVDRGALDAALAANIPCGGWVTWDRMAEDGVIPDRYPVMPLPVAFAPGTGQRTQVREASQSRVSDSPGPGADMDSQNSPARRRILGGYRQRTRQNVADSDGTCILYYEALTGGSRLTRNLCALLEKPYVLVDARMFTEGEAAELTVKFVESHGIQTLNVAGPRLSGWNDGYRFAIAVIREVISRERIGSV
jgi:hypothetical protein